MNKKIEVTIQGISPLLMHAFPMVEVKAIEKKTPEEQAEHCSYRTPENKLYIPGVAIQRCLINAASYSKGKGRASLVKVAAACLLVEPEYCILKQQKYTIDIRPVVVPATKGRILRYRPRFDKWDCSFVVEYDPDLITEEQLRIIVDDAGRRVGMLDFNPVHKGPFGRFMVKNWEIIKE